MNSRKYVDRLRPLTESGSMYAVAKLMGVSPNSVQNYVSGDRQLDAYACLRVAELLNLPLEQVIADIEATREKDPERRKAWQNLAKKFLGSVSAILLTVTAALSGYAVDTHASSSKHVAPAETVHFILCQMRRRWKERATAVFKALEKVVYLHLRWCPATGQSQGLRAIGC